MHDAEILRGMTSPIAGASNMSHIEQAADDATLTPDEVAALEQPYVPRAVLGHA